MHTHYTQTEANTENERNVYKQKAYMHNRAHIQSFIPEAAKQQFVVLCCVNVWESSSARVSMCLCVCGHTSVLHWYEHDLLVSFHFLFNLLLPCHAMVLVLWIVFSTSAVSIVEVETAENDANEEENTIGDHVSRFFGLIVPFSRTLCLNHHAGLAYSIVPNYSHAHTSRTQPTNQPTHMRTQQSRATPSYKVAALLCSVDVQFFASRFKPCTHITNTSFGHSTRHNRNFEYVH